MAIEYPPGTPSWVDLSTPDVDAAVGFYCALFGWDATEPGPVEETGGYRMFTLNGASVAGVAPIMQEGQPTVWSTYIATDDADDLARRVEAAGGGVIAAPFDVMDAGRLAIFTDAAGGAVFGAWQPGVHRGAQVVNQVGALSWNELDTRDPEAAQRFYGEVFGWAATPLGPEGEAAYYSFALGGRTIGGMLPMGDLFPPEVPANWVTYFGSEDLESTTTQVKRLGGNLLMPRREVPAGAFAV